TIAGLESAQHRQDFRGPLADRDLGLLEAPGALFDEHHTMAVALDHGADRDNRPDLYGLGVAHAAEHFGPEAAARIFQFRPHLDGPGLRVDHVGDTHDAGAELFIRISRQGDIHALADLNEADRAFRHVG